MWKPKSYALQQTSTIKGKLEITFNKKENNFNQVGQKF